MVVLGCQKSVIQKLDGGSRRALACACEHYLCCEEEAFFRPFVCPRHSLSHEFSLESSLSRGLEKIIEVRTMGMIELTEVRRFWGVTSHNIDLVLHSNVLRRESLLVRRVYSGESDWLRLRLNLVYK